MTDEVPSIEYDRDPDTGDYVATLDPGTNQAVLTLIALTTEIERTEGIDLPHLYDVLDCDAVRRLVTDHQRAPTDGTIRVDCVTDRLRIEVESSSEEVSVRVGTE